MGIRAGGIRGGSITDAFIIKANPNGVTDSSSAFIAAVNALSDTGGALSLLPGHYRAQAIPLDTGAPDYHPITYIGSGSGSTKIEIIDSPTEPLFKMAQTGDHNGGGVIGMELVGDATSDTAFDGTQHCIDLSSADGVQDFQVSDNWIKRFDRGYNGPARDRSTTMRSNRWWYNNMAVYIEADHPLFEGINDFRENNWAVTGDNIYDMNMTNQKFVRNVYAIMPQPVAGDVTVGKIQACQFVANLFFGNTYGVQLGTNTQVVGGQAVVSPLGTTQWLFKIVDDRVIIQDVTMRGEVDDTPAIVADILLDATANKSWFNISNNLFSTQSASILHSDAAGHFSNGTISGNTIHGYRTFLQGPVTSAHMVNITITDNNYYANGDGRAANTDIIVLPRIATGGVLVTDNIIEVNSHSNWRYWYNGDVPRSFIQGNIIRKGAGGNFTNADANTNLNGLVPGSVAAGDNIYVPA